jgi:predicted dehydrogenase
VSGTTYGFAIVGCGVIAPYHARSIATIPNARLRAVVDVAPDRAARFAAEFEADASIDLDATLARADVDVVCVCLPSGLHAEIGARVAAAGKHLVVEKPIDVSLESADRLIAACRRAGVTLTVICQQRFAPGIQRLRAALDAGQLGRPVLGEAVVKWYRTQQYYDGAGWRGTWDLDGGGALMNQGIHSVDLLQWLLGPVDSVVARCATAAHDIAVEDLALALLTFRGGALGLLNVSTAIYPGFADRLEVTGTEGTVIVEAGEVTLWEVKDGNGEIGPYGRFLRAGARSAGGAAPPAQPHFAAHRAQLLDLLDAIERGREPLVTGEEARKPLEIVQAVYESARRGQAVTLPLGR